MSGVTPTNQASHLTSVAAAGSASASGNSSKSDKVTLAFLRAAEAATTAGSDRAPRGKPVMHPALEQYHANRATQATERASKIPHSGHGKGALSGRVVVIHQPPQSGNRSYKP